MALSYRMYEIRTVDEIDAHLRAIVRGMPNFVNYFTNVGYNNYNLNHKLLHAVTANPSDGNTTTRKNRFKKTRLRS